MSPIWIDSGVRYCVTHNGIANEGGEVCNSTPDRQLEECDIRRLWYEEAS